MKGIYKFGIVALLLFTITSASAITQIGDNITVPNNVTAQNFLGNLNWAYLLGIPTDFPNSTVAGYNGNFPNTSVTNIQGVNTAQNTSISNLQSNDTVHDSKISTIQSNETGYAKLDGSRTVTGSWNWGGFNLTNALRVVASFFEGDGSRLTSLNASNLTGTFNASTDARTNFPNNTVASKEASWDGKTTLAAVNQSADLYNMNASNITSGRLPDARIENASVWNNKTAEYVFWKTTATAGVAAQGLNLLLALTELDSAVAGTRLNISATEIGNNIACSINARALTTATLTINVSVRDTSNTNNVLCFVTFSSTTTGTTFTKTGTYFPMPSWFTGEKQFAVYTEGGNGAADFIFKHIAVRHRD